MFLPQPRRADWARVYNPALTVTANAERCMDLFLGAAPAAASTATTAPV